MATYQANPAENTSTQPASCTHPCLLGAWRWMILVYVYFDAEDRVVVVTIQDGRSSRSPTSER